MSHRWLRMVGSYPCGFFTCKQCIRHKKSRNVTSFSTRESYSLRNYINCNSKMVIYIIECSTYQLQYIGCTIQNVRVRISEHFNDTLNVNAKNISNMGVTLTPFSFLVWSRLEDQSEEVTHTVSYFSVRCSGYTSLTPECQVE